MGVYLCEETKIYEIKNERQGTLFLILAALYLIFEAIYIYQNIWILRKEPLLRKDWTMILFYVVSHVVLIRGLLTFLAGSLVCYPDSIYIPLYYYICILKHTAMFIIMYQVVLTLKLLGHKNAENNCFVKLIGGFFIVDFVLFNLFYILGFHVLDKGFYLAMYTVASSSVQLFLFDYFMYQLMKAFKEHKDRAGDGSVRMWRTLLISANVFFLMRIALKALRVAFAYNTDLANDMLPTLEFAIFLFFYSIITEALIPEALILSMTSIVNQRISRKKAMQNFKDSLI